MKKYWFAHMLPDGKVWDGVYYFVVDVWFGARKAIDDVWFFLTVYR